MKSLSIASLAVTSLSLMLAGCGTVHSVAKGPNGRPMFHIEAISTPKAYERASESCPGGYDILSSRRGTVFALDIECK